MTSKRRVRRTPPPPPPAAPPLLWLAASLALVPLLLFGRSVGFDYVRADDVDLIAGNQTFLADLANAPRVFTRSYFEVDGELSDLETYYRPLVVLSFMLDAQVGGGDPAVYHLTNVALHAAVVLLLFGLALRLGAARTPAFVGALLFAVHPLTVQAVCWVVGRNDILLALFALVSLIGLDAALRGGRWGAPLHVTAFALALFTKETGLVLLPACGLLVWRWYGRPHLFRERWRLIAADLAVVALWTVARQLALAGGAGRATPGEQLTVAAANLPQLLVYFGKAVFPVGLNVMPSVDPAGLTLGVVALGILAWLFRALPGGRRVTVLTWFVLFLLPPLVVPELPAYEHRAYVPLVGLALGLSQLPALSGAGWARHRPRQLALAVAVVFCVLASRHAAVFSDALAHWASATRNTAYAPIAHVNVGRILEERGDLGRAATAYRAALAIDPVTPKANNNLGVVMMAQGRDALALPYFEREIEVNPGNPEAHFNLGLHHKVTGRPADGVVHWERAIELNPYFLPAYEQLIEYSRGAGDSEQADEYQGKLDALRAR